MDDYRRLAQELAELDAARETERRAASGAHAARVAAASGEIDHADQVVRAAEASVRTAGERLDAVEARSVDLWAEMRALLGRRGRRLGDLRDAAAETALESETPEQLLNRASGTIARVALGEPIAPIPGTLIPALPPLGAIAALLVGLPVRALFALTGGRYSGVNLAVEILIFLAPFAGVPALVFWTRHRYGARPDIGAAALTALGGMIASCALVLVFR
ncbi:MAG TPA: hypothetical protein VGJ28_15640 [Micromonosporaceae bacterium]|jgi:hypothetical protein